VTRNDYIHQVLHPYLDAPDTPDKPRRGDRTLAGQFQQQGVPLDLIEHAIALASLRRALRPASAAPLEPIRSLAYLRPLIKQLRRTGIDPSYRYYVAERYVNLKV